MRLLSVFLLSTCGAFAQTPNMLRFPQAMGYVIPGAISSSTFQTNAAANWWDQTFIAQGKTLSSFELYCSAVSGTLGSTDTVFTLYSDSGAGVPGSSIENHSGKCTAAATLTISGFTTALTAGNMYHMVVTNANGVPASNNFTITYGPPSSSGGAIIPFHGNGDGAGGGSWGWTVKTSTNSGSTWSTPSSASIGGILGYSDGTFGGFLLTSTTRPGSVTTADRIFGKQEVGAIFSLPIHAKYNVIGVGMVLSRTSTPGNLQLRLYSGTTLLATTFAITSTQVTTGTTGDSYYGLFSSPQTIDCTSACTVRITGNDATSGDTNSTGYNPALITIPNEATALALGPMNGTAQETLTTDDTVGPPATWTQTATRAVPAWLLLDTNGEFTALNFGGSQVAGNNQFIGPSRIQ